MLAKNHASLTLDSLYEGYACLATIGYFYENGVVNKAITDQFKGCRTPSFFPATFQLKTSKWKNEQIDYTEVDPNGIINC